MSYDKKGPLTALKEALVKQISPDVSEQKITIAYGIVWQVLNNGELGKNSIKAKIFHPPIHGTNSDNETIELEPLLPFHHQVPIKTGECVLALLVNEEYGWWIKTLKNYATPSFNYNFEDGKKGIGDTTKYNDLLFSKNTEINQNISQATRAKLSKKVVVDKPKNQHDHNLYGSHNQRIHFGHIEDTTTPIGKIILETGIKEGDEESDSYLELVEKDSTGKSIYITKANECIIKTDNGEIKIDNLGNITLEGIKINLGEANAVSPVILGDKFLQKFTTALTAIIIAIEARTTAPTPPMLPLDQTLWKSLSTTLTELNTSLATLLSQTTFTK